MPSLALLYNGEVYVMPSSEELQFGRVIRWNTALGRAVNGSAAYDDASLLANYIFSVGDNIGVPVKVALVLVNDTTTCYLYNPAADTAVNASTTCTLMPVTALPSYFLPTTTATIGTIQLQDITNETTVSALATISSNGVITLTTSALTPSAEYIIGDTYSSSAVLGNWRAD